MIEALNRIADRIENAIVVILMLLATLVAIAQVAARYVFNNSLYWSEEFILYALITMSFVAASMGVRHSAHIAVEALYAFAGPRLTLLLKMIAAVLGVIFAGTMVYYGWQLYANTTDIGQLSPAMQIPVAYIYLPIPIAGALMVLRYMLILKKLMLRQDDKTLSTSVNAI